MGLRTRRENGSLKQGLDYIAERLRRTSSMPDTTLYELVRVFIKELKTSTKDRTLRLIRGSRALSARTARSLSNATASNDKCRGPSSGVHLGDRRVKLSGRRRLPCLGRLQELTLHKLGPSRDVRRSRRGASFSWHRSCCVPTHEDVLGMPPAPAATSAVRPQTFQGHLKHGLPACRQRPVRQVSDVAH